MTGKPIVVAVLALIFLPVAASAKWGSPEDATKIYDSEKTSFEEIYDLVRGHPAIQHVSPAYSADSEFLERYKPFNTEDVQVYESILLTMKKLWLERVRVWRDKSSLALISVDFLVYARGVGGGTEGIVIEAWSPGYSIERFHKPSDRCNALSTPNWYVCELT